MSDLPMNIGYAFNIKKEDRELRYLGTGLFIITQDKNVENVFFT